MTIRGIVWTVGLPHLNGLPHLPGVAHLHVNRPLEKNVTWGVNRVGSGRARAAREIRMFGFKFKVRLKSYFIPKLSNSQYSFIDAHFAAEIVKLSEPEFVLRKVSSI